MTPEVREEVRSWAADRVWRETDWTDDPTEGLSDEQIIRAVNRRYVGGWGQFLIDGGFPLPAAVKVASDCRCGQVDCECKCRVWSGATCRCNC